MIDSISSARASWDRIDSAAFCCGEATARRGAKSDAVTSVERRNAAGARRNKTRRAGVFWAAGSSKGSPVVPLRASPSSCPQPKMPPAQRVNPVPTRSSATTLFASDQSKAAEAIR